MGNTLCCGARFKPQLTSSQTQTEKVDRIDKELQTVFAEIDIDLRPTKTN